MRGILHALVVQYSICKNLSLSTECFPAQNVHEHPYIDEDQIAKLRFCIFDYCLCERQFGRKTSNRNREKKRSSHTCSSSHLIRTINEHMINLTTTSNYMKHIKLDLREIGYILSLLHIPSRKTDASTFGGEGTDSFYLRWRNISYMCRSPRYPNSATREPVTVENLSRVQYSI